MQLKVLRCDLIVILLLFYNQCLCITRSLTKHEINNYKGKIVSMFYHSYESYLKYASNYDELQPISCQGMDTWGQFSLSLIDALDTLAVFGNYTEFRRVAQLVVETADFNTNINVSVFETNIRVIGGLLSAHLLSQKAGIETEKGWPCEGPLLRLAEDAGRRLLPAFESKTGMPFGTVNLRYGVPENETPITCTAGVGTFILEFCTLSRLTGDPIFQNKALRAINALHKSRSSIGLVGNHINVDDGKWTATESGIGGGVDSYFEYLVKGAMLLQMPQLMDIFYENYRAINKYIKKEDWYVWVSMTSGAPTMPIFQSLEAFWPGVLTLIGDVDQAKKTIYNYHQIWKQYGFHPEFYDIPNAKLNSKRDGYPLRPEFVESVLYLYRATKDPHLLQIGADVIDSIESSTKTECGFATVKNVGDHTIEDRMESFFLAETLKYLYLLFDESNFVHNDGSTGYVIDRNGSECVVDSGGYVFNTEAHLIDIAAVYCCSNQKKIQSNIMSEFRDNLDLYSVMGINQKPSNPLKTIRDKYREEFLQELHVYEKSDANNDILSESDFHGSEDDLKADSGITLDLDSNEALDSDQTESSDPLEDDVINSMPNTKSPDAEETISLGCESTLTDVSTSSESLQMDSLSPTLDSSLNSLNIPNVDKTNAQNLHLKSESTPGLETTFSDISVGDIHLKETIKVETNTVIDTKVRDSLEPTHSIEGWHSKSLDQQLSEDIISVMNDNTLIDDKLSQQIMKMLSNTSKYELFVNSSKTPQTPDEMNSFNTCSLNYELLLCPSQPFLSRLSYFGQMIVFS
ncbi:unnamed protein product [Medioppia subpectinata]|uniref:alpha-1,2-Mannosidase n=1 Tax=Medioppia subpectinata TaxID=1979941 RepID=A0A7R9KHG0_9ACAR|nr:unnamed protein product [Medioppia subpectinata]CAG2103446.1 unnamed protein product [Medioppia subpectinata]